MNCAITSPIPNIRFNLQPVDFVAGFKIILFATELRISIRGSDDVEWFTSSETWQPALLYGSSRSRINHHRLPLELATIKVDPHNRTFLLLFCVSGRWNRVLIFTRCSGCRAETLFPVILGTSRQTGTFNDFCSAVSLEYNSIKSNELQWFPVARKRV